jgi:hypothetical protein
MDNWTCWVRGPGNRRASRRCGSSWCVRGVRRAEPRVVRGPGPGDRARGEGHSHSTHRWTPVRCDRLNRPARVARPRSRPFPRAYRRRSHDRNGASSIPARCVARRSAALRPRRTSAALPRASPLAYTEGLCPTKVSTPVTLTAQTQAPRMTHGRTGAETSTRRPVGDFSAAMSGECCMVIRTRPTRASVDESTTALTRASLVSQPNS